MNSIYLHIANEKNHRQKIIEADLLSDKVEEKSLSLTNLSNMNNILPKKDNFSFYLHQYQKFFNKKLVIKHNVLPNEYILMNLDNFITAKYCRSLAIFKEKLLFNYDEEFLKRFYPKKESFNKIPLFSEFYKSYLKFFCCPFFAELKLNDLIEEVAEKKAKIFYNENYEDESEKDKNQKKINMIIFTNKIRQDISRVNSLTNLTKTTIKKNINLSKSSKSLGTIQKLFNELNYEDKKEKKNIINNKSEDKTININLSKNKNNKYDNNIKKTNIKNSGIKKEIILSKIKENIKFKNYFRINIQNIKNFDYSSNSNKKNIKTKLTRNIQNKILDSKSSILNENNKIKSIKKLKSLQKNVQNILKVNFKTNHNNKNIQSKNDNSKKKLTNEKNNSNSNQKSGITKKCKITILNNKKKNNTNIFNNSINSKNNTLISNLNTNTITKNINNNFLKINFSKNYYTNFKLSKLISRSINSSINSKININKKKIKKINKPSFNKKKNIKSRNYISITNDSNTINKSNSKNHTKIESSTNYYYFTINDKSTNNILIKFQTYHNSKNKIKKYLRKENKKSINHKSNNIPNSNNFKVKLFDNKNSKNKKNNKYKITSKDKKNSESLSPSVKNLTINTKGLNNYLKKKNIINSKNKIKQVNTNNCNVSNSQKIVKNLKIINFG